MSSHYYDETGTLVPGWTKGAYPSVSTILDRIRSDGYDNLMRRLGLAETDEMMNNAAARGTRIHKACELWVSGVSVAEAAKGAGLLVDELPYLTGFITWWEKYTPMLLNTELFVRSTKYKYAGRCDLVVGLHGHVWIIDIKTGQDNVRHGLQLRGYAQAYSEKYEFTPKMAVLALDAKRVCGYRNSKSELGLQEFNESLASWLHHVQVFKWWARKLPIVKPVDGGLVWKV